MDVVLQTLQWPPNKNFHQISEFRNVTNQSNAILTHIRNLVAQLSFHPSRIRETAWTEIESWVLQSHGRVQQTPPFVRHGDTLKQVHLENPPGQSPIIKLHQWIIKIYVVGYIKYPGKNISIHSKWWYPFSSFMIVHHLMIQLIFHMGNYWLTFIDTEVS